MNTKLRAFAAVLCLCVFLVSVYKVVTIALEYKEGRDSYKALEQFAAFEAPAGWKADEAPGSEPIKDPLQIDAAQAGEIEGPAPFMPRIDFAALKEINPDICGWIFLPDTIVNYPVAQGANNDYYLYHLFDRTYNQAGCIFLDHRNSDLFTDGHSVIYGHHMKDGSMFKELANYKKQEYYDAHPELYLFTPDGNYTLELFSGYVADVWSDSWKIIQKTEKPLADWAKEACLRSCFQSGIAPEEGDRILTLSTCSYEFEDARFVLHAILRPW